MTPFTPHSQRDRVDARRRDRQAQQTRLEREIQSFFQQAGVRTVNLDEMFQEIEWPA